MYLLYDSFIYRAPLLPFNKIDESFVWDPIFKEALFLASRDLYESLEEYSNETEFEQLPSKLQLSCYKYLLRMATRCTPFGLFAGCGTGKINGAIETSKFILKNSNSNVTKTRLDMDFIAIVNKAITSNPLLRTLVKFYPNNSLYEIGASYRYVEYSLNNKRRKYFLSELEDSEYIRQILEIARSGATLKEIKTIFLAQNDLFSEADIHAFLLDLCESQILIDELYPNVTGPEPINKLINFLSQPYIEEHTAGLLMLLKQTRLILENLDEISIGRPVSQYQLIEENIKQLRLSYNPSHLFQSDMYLRNPECVVSTSIIKSLSEGLKALNILTIQKPIANLNKFKDAFLKRYETREVRLTEVLDTDIGFGFSDLTPESAGTNPLLDNVFIKNREGGIGEITVNPVECLFLSKYHDFLKNGLSEIEITDEDLARFPENWSDLPDTISVMAEIIRSESDDDTPLVYIKNAGGSSAANLLARFASSNEDIFEIVKFIINKENELIKSDQIIAEIVHLPEDRAGNILLRPTLHKYEIAYLAMPAVENDRVISISDIMVSIVDGKIKLRCNRLNKEILPRLTSAHNFTAKTLPIYNFLCMCQYDNKRVSLAFNWGALLKQEISLPRVRYKSVLLAPAIFKVALKEVQHLIGSEDIDLVVSFSRFAKARELPNKCLICNQDNKLLIDFNSQIDINVFLKEIKRHEIVTLEEFLFQENSNLVKDNEAGNYTNEFLFTFYKND